ncbi:archaeal flagellin N-terminal-like domain-containing protein [Sarocladium implicatum]|nr:archaeal flagellin N-terminal-like domain-containing protein [Sarocladium implicatum]
MSLAYVAVGARLWVRLFLKRTRLQLSDVLLLIGLLCAQGLLICDTLTYEMGQMHNFTDPSVRLSKIRFATNYFFDFGIYFPKFSIIALYYGLVPSWSRTMRIALHVLASITIGASLFTLFADTFWCGPDISINWLGPEGSCSVFESMELMRANWALNFLTEVLNCFFPMPIVAGLMLKTRREKISICAIFAMGFITIGVSIGRFATMVYVDNATPIYILATAELCISIIVVALIALRPLLQKLTRLISTSFAGSHDDSVNHNSGAIRPSFRKTWDLINPFPAGLSGSGSGSSGSRVVATNRSKDPMGSEIELTGRGIVRTKEVSVRSEPATSFDRDSDSILYS